MSLKQNGRVILSLDKVGKQFSVGKRLVEALHNVNVSIEEGEFVCIVGPSGCGKSTILRLVVGLEAPGSGTVILNGVPVSGPGIERAIVFQEHRLLPWLSVRQNIALGLDTLQLSKTEKNRIVDEHIVLVGLQGFENAYPRQLSGGMAQRAAIARALVAQPQILLLDEPLGALDSLTRSYLQDELLRIWRQQNITSVMVTHDVEEAVFLSDRVVIMDAKPGRIESIVTVDLDRPRLRGSPEFAALKDRIMRSIHHPAAQTADIGSQ